MADKQTWMFEFGGLIKIPVFVDSPGSWLPLNGEVAKVDKKFTLGGGYLIDVYNREQNGSLEGYIRVGDLNNFVMCLGWFGTYTDPLFKHSKILITKRAIVGEYNAVDLSFVKVTMEFMIL